MAALTQPNPNYIPNNWTSTAQAGFYELDERVYQLYPGMNTGDVTIFVETLGKYLSKVLGESFRGQLRNYSPKNEYVWGFQANGRIYTHNGIVPPRVEELVKLLTPLEVKPSETAIALTEMLFNGI